MINSVIKILLINHAIILSNFFCFNLNQPNLIFFKKNYNITWISLNFTLNTSLFPIANLFFVS